MKMKQIPQNTVVHTPTEEEAKELLAILHENGYSWALGTSLTEKPYWSNYAENTCYRITKYIGYCSRDWYESKGHPILTLAEFKHLYCEEEKPRETDIDGKFHINDKVIITASCPLYGKGWIGTVVQCHESYVDVAFGLRLIPHIALCDLAPYTEPETKTTEDMEAKELNRCEKCGATTQQCMDAPCQDYPVEKELNLVELLKGHDRETFWSPLFGDIRFFRINTDDNKPLFFEWKEGSIYTYPDGKMYSGTLPIVFPSRTLYEQYPLDPYTAWMKWKEEQKPKYYIEVHYGVVNGISTNLDEVLFRNYSDRDKCIEEIKAVIEKYS